MIQNFKYYNATNSPENEMSSNTIIMNCIKR